VMDCHDRYTSQAGSASSILVTRSEAAMTRLIHSDGEVTRATQ
jgi:hypothetical protein